ncbi:Plant SNARE 12 [Picochlorum sp. SENEW3]|nr:hypothetical protein M9434_005005 [Picochlorum sp. BPE23]KAI8101152.1 hypothetical protein M9435_001260 [Picochlorum sp. BPE23]WPT11902.1 Plant SNARE 12 [Picochlorum sp. SENEW3]WPT17397.1 Plant SNARE 12 [Picochlorum sp. SENEW3]
MSTFSSGTQRQASRVYEQEVSLNHIFDDLSEGFKKLDSMNDSKKQSELKRMTGLMQEAKSLIRDFEREAKIDNMSVDELNYRKKLLVQELNSFIGLKKAYSQQLQQRKELMDSKSPVAAGPSADEIREMSTNDMIELGRKNIQETDESLLRSERVVNDTIAIGAQTAETLQTQGNQLNKISNDLDEIHFSMKKARQVIRDLARRLATDRCIMFVLLLVIIGIVVIVVLKITGVGDVNV